MCIAGFQTTLLPAASAGAMISAAIVYGQFQGVMTPDDAARHALDEDALGGVDRRREEARARRVASAAAIRK